MRRVLSVLLTSTVTIVTLGVAGGVAEGQALPKPVKVSCGSLSGNVTGTPAPPTLSLCNQPGVTGGGAGFTFFEATSGAFTIDWKAGGSTSVAFSTTVLPLNTKADKCPVDPTASVTSPPTKDTEVILHGKVTPPGDGGVKGALTAKICVTSALDLSLLKGSFKV